MKATDPLSGQVFTKRVVNQRFSSRENQIRFNNQKANDKRRALNDYWKVLTHNRDILQRTLDNKAEQTVSRDFLIGAGYDFTFYTHSGINEKHRVVGVFEFGLIPLTGNRYKIIRFHNRLIWEVATFNPSKP